MSKFPVGLLGLPSKSEFSRMLDTEREAAEEDFLLNEQIMSVRLGGRDQTLERTVTPIIDKGKNHSKMGSVFPRGSSPVQDFRFRSSTVSDDEFISQEKADAGRDGHLSYLYDSDGREYVEEIVEEQRKRRSQCPSGDFHYLPSSRPQDRGDHSDTTGKRNHAGTSFSSERALFPPQTNPDPSLPTNNGAPISQGVVNGERGVAERVCTPPPSSEGKFVEEGTRGAKVERDMSVHSWVVPDRFHQGRESLSVKRNITKRESRRPKTRSSDQDYQRRYSMSPQTMKHSLGLQFPVHHLGEIADGVPSPMMEGTRSHRDSGGSGFSYTPPVVENKGGYGHQPITETTWAGFL